ncbi:sugar lactone lactonase YvrE [Prosthecobacter fusiformis]|uniref:Sugar lactone lactonase YvrE n=1 Tax=Prosthecobacter fusiformis TaxID=48464 RepID=A0A4R7SQK2_9BACT|nr:L-dopachrome tautomerase-related protein [Prosthecobacter fusiformis]TDU81311.1 sugar lactone lactonase YvrE [Prosthecobacter fusiformis]
MKTISFLCFLAALSTLRSIAAPPETSPTLNLNLEEAAVFQNQQITGVTVSKTGRLFVNFPFWSDDHTDSVLEILPDGSTRPYPDSKWNNKKGAAKSRFICVQSVYVDDEDTLWILDPASPKMEAVVPDGPKLLQVNLKTDKVTQVFRFDPSVTPEKSYLNDIRVDIVSGHAFITDSGTGALIVLDIKTGKARRLLHEHPSTKAEEGVELLVDGIKVIDPKTGKAPQIHSDGIALDKEGGWLYYHALTGRTLYRIATADLINPKLTTEELGKKVVNVATTSAPDGMLEADNGSLYLTAIESGAIVHFDPRSKETATLIEDSRIQWPDTLSLAPDGTMYITASQIHRMPQYNGGKSQQKGPYTLYRFKMNPPSPKSPEEQAAQNPDSPLPNSSTGR